MRNINVFSLLPCRIYISAFFFIEMMHQNGFDVLGVTAQVSNWNARNDEFSIILESNPLAEFVEVPPELAQDLRY